MESYSTGEKIRIFRTMSGLSQKGLARLVGLKQENISYIENNRNKKPLKKEILLSLIKALNIDEKQFHSLGLTADKINLIQDNADENGVQLSDKIMRMQTALKTVLDSLNEVFEK